MNHVEFRRALLRLCRERPDFREKLAAEARRSGSTSRSVTARRDPGHMVWQALRKMTDRVPELAAMVHDDADELEEWQQHQIVLAAEYIDAAYDSLRYSMEDDSF